jgi:hypothetical protein
VLEQQLGKLGRARMPGFAAFAFADDARQQRKGIVPVVPPRGFGIGAGSEQCARNRDGVLGGRRGRQARIAKVLQRQPTARAARERSLRAVGREPALDLCEVAGDDGRVQAEACDVGVLAQDVRRHLAAVAVECVAHKVVGALRRAALRELAVLEQLFDRRPIRDAVLERERMLNFAQRRACACVWQRLPQAFVRRGVALAQRLQPALRFFLEGF